MSRPFLLRLIALFAVVGIVWFLVARSSHQETSEATVSPQLNSDHSGTTEQPIAGGAVRSGDQGGMRSQREPKRKKLSKFDALKLELTRPDLSDPEEWARNTQAMIAELSAEQYDQLVDEFKRDERKELLGFIINAYADHDPVGAMQVFINQPDLMELNDYDPLALGLYESVAPKLSKTPEESIAWFEKNRDKLNRPFVAYAGRAILSGFAQTSPDQALQVATKLGFDAAETASILGKAPRSPAEMTNLLGALRKTGDDPELLNSVLTSMTSGLLIGGTDQALEWIGSNDLTPAEATAILAGTEESKTSRPMIEEADGAKLSLGTGRWLATLGDLAGEAGQTEVERVMSAWVAADYQAAGEWLLTRKDTSATTRAAVAAFAETAAPYDPEGASRWVETLPRDARRKAAAGKVVQEWLAIDPDAARNFAAREGLRPGF